MRRARVQVVATELGLQKAYLLFIFKIILLTYLFLAALGLCCFSLVAASRGSSLVMMHRLLILVASLVADPHL